MGIFRRIFWLLVILALPYAIWVWASNTFQSEDGNSQHEEASFKNPEKIPLKSIVVQVDTEKDKRRILSCEDGKCAEEKIPEKVSTNSVTDSKSWYYYAQQKIEKSNKTKKVLLRKFVEGNQVIKKIVEETELVLPRDLIISPDGKRVVYFLDNIDEPEEDLTELWVFDDSVGGTRLAAEKIVAGSIKSKVRWNRASNYMWFLGDTAEAGEQEKLNLHVVSVDSSSITLPFSNQDWSSLLSVANYGVMDINFSGNALAYATLENDNSSLLTVIQEGRESRQTTVRGSVPYLRWLEDGSLLYIIQDKNGFTFWMQKGTVNRFIARKEGQFQSAQGDNQGNYIVFTSKKSKNVSTLYNLQTESGFVSEEGNIPKFGDSSYVVHVKRKDSKEPQVAGITHSLSDEELFAFIDSHAAEIIGEKDIQPTRIIITDQENTLYIDYRNKAGKEERLLVTIRDAINAEWSIKGRFKANNGEWIKVEGSGLHNPTGIKLYDWEESVSQWILKSEDEGLPQ